MDQIIIGDKASFDDFAASVATRKVKMPKKKSIRETVPFSNITYDFSAIDGEIYWEDRELEYVFELTADNPEELEELKSRFAAWVMSVQGHELHDPYIPDYHFLATYDDMDPEDDEGLDKCTLTVKFTAYPYKIANLPKVYDTLMQPSQSINLDVYNESDHPVSLSIENEVKVTLRIDSGSSASFTSGKGTYPTIRISKGLHTITIANSTASPGHVLISFYEEVI